MGLLKPKLKTRDIDQLPICQGYRTRGTESDLGHLTAKSEHLSLDAHFSQLSYLSFLY